MPRSKLVTPSPCGSAIIEDTSLEGLPQPSRPPKPAINKEAMTMPQLLGDGRIMFCTNSSSLALRTNLGIVATVAYYPLRGRRNQPAYVYSFSFRRNQTWTRWEAGEAGTDWCEIIRYCETRPSKLSSLLLAGAAFSVLIPDCT